MSKRKDESGQVGLLTTSVPMAAVRDIRWFSLRWRNRRWMTLPYVTG